MERMKWGSGRYRGEEEEEQEGEEEEALMNQNHVARRNYK